MTINDLYANAMVQLNELTQKYNNLVKAAEKVKQDYTFYKDKNEELVKENENLKAKIEGKRKKAE